MMRDLRVMEHIDPANEHTVVLVNALGMDVALADRLKSAIVAHKMNFVTWTLRGTLREPGDGFRHYSTATHVADLAAITESLNIRRPIVMSWCSGNAIAISAIATGAITPCYFLSFNSPNYANHPRKPMAGDSFDKVSAVIVKDEDKLDYYHASVMERTAFDRALEGVEDQKMIDLILTPYKTDSHTMLRNSYAIVNSASKAQIREWCGSIKVPARFYGSGRDNLVSAADALALSRLVKGAVYIHMEEWTHYHFFMDTSFVVEELARCIDAVSPSRARAVL